MQVYSDAYFLRLREVLAEDFPETRRVIGEERFDKLARDYLRKFPSENPSVRYLGRRMAEFVASRTSIPSYMGELARVEWLMGIVFDAADVEAMTLDDLRKIPPEHWPHLRFHPIPALTLMHSGWPVHEHGPAVRRQ